jgi:hypothetical protein
MEKIFSSLILLLLSFGCQTASDSKNPDRNPALRTDIDKIFESWNNSNSPGCELAINGTSGGKMIWISCLKRRCIN